MFTKEGVGIAVGIVMGFVAKVFGGWDLAIRSLLIFMLIDMIFGILAAGVFHKSKKVEGESRLSSSVGIKGLAKKMVVLLLVVMAYQMDLLLEMNYIRSAAAYAFAFFEGVSILELAKLMGVPLPEILYDAVSLLGKRSKPEKEGEGDN